MLRLCRSCQKVKLQATAQRARDVVGSFIRRQMAEMHVDWGLCITISCRAVHFEVVEAHEAHLRRLLGEAGASCVCW